MQWQTYPVNFLFPFWVNSSLYLSLPNTLVSYGILLRKPGIKQTAWHLLMRCPDFSQLGNVRGNASIDCCWEWDETLLKKSSEKNYSSNIEDHAIKNSNCSLKIRHWTTEILKFTARKFVRIFKRNITDKVEISSVSKQYYLRKFEENSSTFVSFEISLFFATLRWNSSKFALITFAQYCTEQHFSVYYAVQGGSNFWVCG